MIFTMNDIWLVHVAWLVVVVAVVIIALEMKGRMWEARLERDHAKCDAQFQAVMREFYKNWMTKHEREIDRLTRVKTVLVEMLRRQRLAKRDTKS